MKLRRIWPFILLVAIVGLNIALFMNRVWLMDWLRLRNYSAPAAVSSLATDVTMTSYSERLFYVNHPALEDKASFNQHCADHLEHSAVLGCYHGDRRGIFIYDVTDKRLQGVEQVTAAHEMLHQAYDRLSISEKKRIAGLLQNFNDTQLKDTSVKEKLNLYRQADTVDLTNEMHSIFGTEVSELPAELEDYYKQYFTDRHKVVSFSQQYRAEFDKLKEQVATYDKQLESLQKEIEANKAELDADLATIQAKERQLQRGPGGNVDAYNSEVRAYNRRVDAYNAKVESTRKMIDQYNKIVAERNSIAFAERQLQEALDSRLTPVAQ